LALPPPTGARVKAREATAEGRLALTRANGGGLCQFPLKIRDPTPAKTAGEMPRFSVGVSTRISWCFNGTRVSVLEERSALAVGHRLVADALERTPPDENWSFATSVSDSYRDITSITVTLELGFGTEDEMERAQAFMAEMTRRLK
jgi:hypothetical protein